MKIKIVYNDGGVCPVVKEFENGEALDVQFTNAYVKIQNPAAEKCLFMVKAERFISAERIE